MKIIGLCSGSGSGKGTVANILSELDIPSVDTDAVYHQLVNHRSPCLDALVDEFGSEILSSDGSLDRLKLSEIVFKSENASQKRQKLNQISHKFVLDKTREILREYQRQGKKAALVDAPLLFESGFDKECDFTIAVIADKAVRINRITNRDNISVETAGARINAQLADEELLAKCDFTINNSGSIEELREQVRSLYSIIFKK